MPGEQISSRGFLDVEPGERLTVRYSSVYGDVDSETELTAVVDSVERQDYRATPATWLTIYLDPVGERDRRSDHYRETTKQPPRRLEGVVYEEADDADHSMTLETRNGVRWNRLSTGRSPAVFRVEEGER